MGIYPVHRSMFAGNIACTNTNAIDEKEREKDRRAYSMCIHRTSKNTDSHRERKKERETVHCSVVSAHRYETFRNARRMFPPRARQFRH